HEQVEDSRQHVFGNPGAVVLDAQHDVGVDALGGQYDMAAAGRVLRGVREQVADDLAQAGVVAVDVQRLVGQLDAELVARVLDQRGRSFDRIGDRVAQIHRLPDQVQPVAADPARIEQVVHEPNE